MQKNLWTLWRYSQGKSHKKARMLGVTLSTICKQIQSIYQTYMQMVVYPLHQFLLAKVIPSLSRFLFLNANWKVTKSKEIF